MDADPNVSTGREKVSLRRVGALIA